VATYYEVRRKQAIVNRCVHTHGLLPIIIGTKVSFKIGKISGTQWRVLGEHNGKHVSKLHQWHLIEGILQSNDCVPQNAGLELCLVLDDQI